MVLDFDDKFHTVICSKLLLVTMKDSLQNLKEMLFFSTTCIAICLAYSIIPLHNSVSPITKGLTFSQWVAH